MDKIHDFEKEGTLSFSNRTKLIQFVSQYLAFQYKQKLEYWSATEAASEDELFYWERRIEKEIPKLQKAIKKILKRLLHKKTLEISANSVILEEAFKKAKIKGSPKVCFFPNVKYRIDNLIFVREFD